MAILKVQAIAGNRFKARAGAVEHFDVDDDVLTVHWIDCPPGTDIAAATAAIADGFERHLRGFLK